MQGLLGVSRAIDRVTVALGQAVSSLILLAVLVSAANAVSRKAFSLSSNAWLELQWYLFGAAFMLAAAYTLQRNEHIRIDIVSSLLPKAARDWIDVVCHFLMLVPYTLLMIALTWPSLVISYKLGETSSNFGGLIVWPAKAFIVSGYALLLIQVVSEVIKRLAVIMRLIPDPHAHQPAHQVPVE